MSATPRAPETETLDDEPPDTRELAATLEAPSPAQRAPSSEAAPEEQGPAHPLHFVALALACIIVVFVGELGAHFLFASVVPRSTLSSGTSRLPLVRAAAEALSYLVGALVLSRRRPSDAMLQLVVVGLLLMGVNTASVAMLTTAPADAPPNAWRALALALYTLAPVTSFVIFAVYPSGRPVPRFALGFAALGVVPFVVFAWTMYREHRFAPGPLLVGMAAVSVMLAFQAYRYRRHATIRQQHQIKWMAYGATLFVVVEVLTVTLVSPWLDPTSRAFPFLTIVHEALLFGAYLIPFLSLALSAAQLRLWDVDRLINRSLVYGTVTAVLGGAFTVVFIGLRDVAGAAIGALVVVVAFVPMRRLVTRWVDRRFYGIGLDYEELVRRAGTVSSLPATGDTFASFVHLRLLGRGGMGAVYRASHPDYDFAVVIKIMSKEVAARPSSRARFRREAAILEQIDHPNVVPFLDRGEDYLVMTYVEGRDLASILAEGKLPLDHALRILRDVAAALDAVHAKGIVHRDVKPANVLVGPERAWLMDFGVARTIGGSDEGDEVVGTLAYIAPEQLRDPRGVDARADLYALAVTAFEMLTGRLPFLDTAPLALALAHVQLPPPRARSIAPELPAHVDAARAAGLAKAPADRCARASDFVRALSGPPGSVPDGARAEAV